MGKPIFSIKEISDLFLPYILAGELPSRKTFGNNFINGVKHWWFPKADIQESYASDRLKILDLEFGDICGLRCEYCFRADDERDISLSKNLTLDEWKNLIDQAFLMGVEAVKLIGAGEFFEDGRFMDAFRYLTEKGIKAVLFTAGYVLADEKKTIKLHGMTPDEIIDYLYKNGHSVFIKGDSFKPEVMDAMVHRKNFSDKRNIVLKKLLERGFTDESPTRLGLEVQANIHNFTELLDIDKLKYYLNIYSDMVTSMPCGIFNLRKETGRSIDLSLDQKFELYKAIYRQNIDFDIPFGGIFPFIGGLKCSQLGNGLYINVKGDVYACPGCFEKLGNIKGGNDTLKTVWNSHQERAVFQKDDYICPPRENAGITPTFLYEEIARNISERSGRGKD
ncbi:MAG: radical SAM protein [Candidatus Pacebacteria bacterium]|nr:radical SAM protein [Candidatus Paceibacterota bacterium]